MSVNELDRDQLERRLAEQALFRQAMEAVRERLKELEVENKYLRRTLNEALTTPRPAYAPPEVLAAPAALAGRGVIGIASPGRCFGTLAPMDAVHAGGHRRRLRERFQAGPKVLPDYELLELLLTYAIPRRDVKPLAKALMARFGSLKSAMDALPAEVRAVPGMGEGAAVFLSAVRSAVERYMSAPARQADALTSPEAVAAYCRAALEGLKHEVFEVIYLNVRNRVLRMERLSEGTVDQTAVYPRRVVRGALENHAASLILVHNHPSGDPSPSAEDKALTRRISAAAKLVDVAVVDHVIVGDGRHFSFRQAGLLPEPA